MFAKIGKTSPKFYHTFGSKFLLGKFLLNIQIEFPRSLHK